MALTKETKQALIKKYARDDKDTGSCEVQIAILTEEIKELTEHLKEIDLNSEQKVHSIIQDMAKKDGIPVYFDATKIEQLEWVKCMNNYKNIAEEIVNNELIFC